jgi:hypothetical protein
MQENAMPGLTAFSVFRQHVSRLQHAWSLSHPWRVRAMPRRVKPDRSSAEAIHPDSQKASRAMPPLTGVGERCAPRATWSCIDEPLKSPGRSRSSSLPTPVKGRAWRHRLLRKAFMSTVTAHPRSLKLPGMLDEPGGSLPSTCSQGHAVQNGHLVLNAKQCWVGEARSRRCVTPIHGREVPHGLHILMKVPDRIAQLAIKSQAPEASEGSPVPLLKVASPKLTSPHEKSTRGIIGSQSSVRQARGIHAARRRKSQAQISAA